MVSHEMVELIKNGKGLDEQKRLYATSLSEIVSKIPKKVMLENKDFIKTYFRAQLRYARGQDKRAGQILDGLYKSTGFLEFEDKNESLLAAIDIAVKGFSKRRDFKMDPVKPLF